MKAKNERELLSLKTSYEPFLECEQCEGNENVKKGLRLHCQACMPGMTLATLNKGSSDEISFCLPCTEFDRQIGVCGEAKSSIELIQPTEQTRFLMRYKPENIFSWFKCPPGQKPDGVGGCNNRVCPKAKVQVGLKDNTELSFTEAGELFDGLTCQDYSNVDDDDDGNQTGENDDTLCQYCGPTGYWGKTYGECKMPRCPKYRPKEKSAYRARTYEFMVDWIEDELQLESSSVPRDNTTVYKIPCLPQWRGNPGAENYVRHSCRYVDGKMVRIIEDKCQTRSVCEPITESFFIVNEKHKLSGDELETKFKEGNNFDLTEYYTKEKNGLKPKEKRISDLHMMENVFDKSDVMPFMIKNDALFEYENEKNETVKIDVSNIGKNAYQSTRLNLKTSSVEMKIMALNSTGLQMFHFWKCNDDNSDECQVVTSNVLPLKCDLIGQIYGYIENENALIFSKYSEKIRVANLSTSEEFQSFFNQWGSEWYSPMYDSGSSIDQSQKIWSTNVYGDPEPNQRYFYIPEKYYFVPPFCPGTVAPNSGIDPKTVLLPTSYNKKWDPAKPDFVYKYNFATTEQYDLAPVTLGYDVDITGENVDSPFNEELLGYGVKIVTDSHKYFFSDNIVKTTESDNQEEAIYQGKKCSDENDSALKTRCFSNHYRSILNEALKQEKTDPENFQKYFEKLDLYCVTTTPSGGKRYSKKNSENKCSEGFEELHWNTLYKKVSSFVEEAFSSCFVCYSATHAICFICSSTMYRGQTCNKKSCA